MSQRVFSLALICSLIFCSGLSAIAAEPKSAALLQTLPADGAWVTFNISVKVDNQEFALTSTARSVGQVTIDGKKCRCIEYEQIADVPPANGAPQLGNVILRSLVPEDEFGEGKDPLSNAVKLWIKIGDEEVEPIASLEVKDPIFALLLRGPQKKLKVEEAKEKINWQRGQLDSAVISGENSLELGVIKLGMMMRLFRHPEVPFGIAGLHEDLKASFGGQDYNVVIQVALKDHGTAAKAKLPDLVK